MFRGQEHSLYLMRDAMSNVLTAIRLISESSAVTDPLVCDFDCGSELHQTEVADFIRGEWKVAEQYWTMTWIYTNRVRGDDGRLAVVGFSSLGPTNWNYPTKKSRKTPVLVIPNLAIAKAYWGGPEGCDRDSRYSPQIMAHVLEQAALWPVPMPAVGLFVHPENAAAIRLYTHYDFEPFHTQWKCKQTGVVYRGYLRRLAPSSLIPAPSP